MILTAFLVCTVGTILMAVGRWWLLRDLPSETEVESRRTPDAVADAEGRLTAGAAVILAILAGTLVVGSPVTNSDGGFVCMTLAVLIPTTWALALMPRGTGRGPAGRARADAPPDGEESA